MLAKPLKGIKVVELANNGAAPSAGRVLADWGADVLKVEAPSGDILRRTGDEDGLSTNGGTSPGWELFNGNKRDIALNIKTEEGAAVMDHLLETADVFLSNNRIATLERNKLDYDTLSAKYPSLVWAHLSGFGIEGPGANDPGYDTVSFWARGGLMNDVVEKGDSVAVPPIAVADLMAGPALAGGILAALWEREKTGKGNKVLISLYGIAVWATGYMGMVTQRPKNTYPKSRKDTSPLNNTYKCKDGEWILLSMFDYERLFPVACRIFDMPDYADDPRFADINLARTNCLPLIEAIDEAMAKKTSLEWDQILRENDCPHSILKHFKDVRDDEQAIANGYVYHLDTKYNGEFMMPSPPVQIGASEAPEHRNAPLLGEHTAEILREYGYDEDTIKDFYEKGVVK